MINYKVIESIERRSFLRTAFSTLLTTTTAAWLFDGVETANAATLVTLPRNLDQIKVLAFDFQGSCMNFYDPINDMGQVINSEKGLSLNWADLTKNWIVNLYQLVGNQKEIYIPATQLFRLSLDEMLEQRDLSNRFTNSEREEIMKVWDRMIPWPDTAEGLSRLKRKFALTTLSNSSMASVFQLVRKHSLPFDQVLTGELVHAYKPSSKVYNLVNTMLGYQKNEVLFCSTHLADIKAAKEFGFKTAWWPRPNETGPGTTTNNSSSSFVDISVKDIIGLAERLGA